MIFNLLKSKVNIIIHNYYKIASIFYLYVMKLLIFYESKATDLIWSNWFVQLNHRTPSFPSSPAGSVLAALPDQ